MALAARDASSPAARDKGGDDGVGEISSLRDKLRLLEADRRNYFESSQKDLKSNREEITHLRSENKNLKATITAAKRGTGTVLEKELQQLDHGIYTTTLRLDKLKSEGDERRFFLKGEKEKLVDIEMDCEPLLTEESYMTRKIRLLENRLDKSLIKYNEALSIKKTYEQIVKRLKEERVGFDNQLAAIERTLQAKDHDYQELLKMSHEANHAKEVAKKELQEFKQQFDEERRNKDHELAERKAYVQGKVDQTQRLEKREKGLRQKEQDEARAKLDEESPANRRGTGTIAARVANQSMTPEEAERLSQYESAFKAIKEATGVEDVNDLLQKFVHQEETHRNLEQMVRDSQNRIDQLNVEKASLVGKLEELRYAGSGQLGSRRIVEEFEMHLAEAQNQTKANGDRYERLARLLINVKAGIDHLADKIAHVRSEITVPKPITDDNVVDVAKIVEHKLVNLADEVVPSDAAEEGLITSVAELPRHNHRVRLQGADDDDQDDADDLDMMEDPDDDAVLKREQVKKISANSIQRETKKLKRRHRRDK